MKVSMLRGTGFMPKRQYVLMIVFSLLLMVTHSLTSVRAAGDEPELSSQSATGVSASSSIYGNFNGDSFDDLAIGVPFEDIGAINAAGAVNVLYGAASGLQTSSPADQFWSQDSSIIQDTAEGGDNFGSSLAACDFNNDGRDDLAVGVQFENVGSASAGGDAGAVHVIYGSASGLSTKGTSPQYWTQDSPDVEDAVEVSDTFGSSLAAGNFNDDSFCDLAIGVPLENVGATGDAGAVNVLYGSASGLSATATPDQLWTQNSANVEGASEASDMLGSALAVGDFNNDGWDDLAIGASGEDIGTINSAGGVNVLYGSSVGLSAISIDGTGRTDQLWHQDIAGVNDLAEASDMVGSALAVGDFNNDGWDDLAIGASGEDVGAINAAGAVNVLYSSATGLQTSSPADQFWSQDSSGVPDVAEDGDNFGSSLAACDFNNDGRDDLAVGVPTEDVSGFSDAGAVNALYGSATGLQTLARVNQFWSQDSAAIENAAEDFDKFGSSLAVGDFNNDSFCDLAIGASGEDVGLVNAAGAAGAIYGSSQRLKASEVARGDGRGDQFWSQDSSGVEDSAEADDGFGGSLA